MCSVQNIGESVKKQCKSVYTAYITVLFDVFQEENVGSSGIWTRDLSHPKRESYP